MSAENIVMGREKSYLFSSIPAQGHNLLIAEYHLHHELCTLPANVAKQEWWVKQVSIEYGTQTWKAAVSSGLNLQEQVAGTLR